MATTYLAVFDNICLLHEGNRLFIYFIFSSYAMICFVLFLLFICFMLLSDIFGKMKTAVIIFAQEKDNSINKINFTSNRLFQ